MRVHSKSTLITSLLLARGALADDELVDPVSKDNSEQCGCYVVSGSDPGYFQYHRFWDFRDIASVGDDDYTVAPPLLTDDQNMGTEAITSSYLNSTEFTTDWSILNGPENPNAAVPTFDTAQNVYISRNTTDGALNSTYLTLRVQRHEQFTSSAEIDLNQRNIKHASIRGRFRVIPNDLSGSSAPAAANDGRELNSAENGSNLSHPVNDGAVFGFFTYHNDKQESDIEVLTSDPIDNIRYSNQPDYDPEKDESVPGASTQAVMPRSAVWTEWHDHRIDWFDGISRWYVDGELVLEKTINVPTSPSGFIMNLWSDGGSWSGNMSVGTTVLVGVQWVDMVFNVSGAVDGGPKRRDLSLHSSLQKRRESSCHVGCSVDNIKTVGFPEQTFNSSSMAFSFSKQGPGGGAYLSVGIAAVSALLIVFV